MIKIVGDIFPGGNICRIIKNAANANNKIREAIAILAIFLFLNLASFVYLFNKVVSSLIFSE